MTPPNEIEKPKEYKFPLAFGSGIIAFGTALATLAAFTWSDAGFYLFGIAFNALGGAWVGLGIRYYYQEARDG